jgi:hypothetical protein
MTFDGTIRQDTAVTRADGSVARIASDRNGAARVNANLGDMRMVEQISVTGNTLPTALTWGSCDGIVVDVDGAQVYYMPLERPRYPSATGSDWTGGAGWSVSGNTWTAAGAISTDLAATDATGLTVGQTYLTCFELTTRAAGTVTPTLGATSGTARSTTATSFVEALACTTARGFKFASSGFTGTIDISKVWLLPLSPKMPAYSPIAYAASIIAAATLSSTIHAVYHRKQP